MGAEPSDTKNNLYPTDPIHSLQSSWEGTLVNSLTFQLCPSWYPPDEFGLHSHGPNLWEPHYPSPRCYRGRVMTQDTDPSVRHPSRHALTLSFSRPVSICMKGISEPGYQAWFPISQVSKISFPGAWGSVQSHRMGVKACGAQGPVFHPSLLNLRVNPTISGRRVMMGHKLPRY